MKSWILSICAVIILTTIVSFILPDGKMKKPIESVFSLLTIIAIISPLFSIDLLNFKFDLVNDYDFNYQESFLGYISESKKQKNLDDCKIILKDLGINNTDVLIYYIDDSELEIKRISINLKNSVIISEKEHIDIINEAKKDISDYFQIEKSNVIFIE